MLQITRRLRLLSQVKVW